MDIKPIKTEIDYKAALEEIKQIFDAPEGTEDFDRQDILATLIQVYESKHCHIDAPDPVAAIEYAMEKRGLSRKDLEPILGHSGRVSEIMSRQRPLSISMIRKLHTQLGIPADVLIQDYQVAA